MPTFDVASKRSTFRRKTQAIQNLAGTRLGAVLLANTLLSIFQWIVPADVMLELLGGLRAVDRYGVEEESPYEIRRSGYLGRLFR
jgi:hypothetical protein